MKSREEVIKSMWMLRAGVAGDLFDEHPDDARRLAGIADHLPALDAADVDADTMVWFATRSAPSPCLVVGKFRGNDRALVLVYAAGESTAHVYVQSPGGVDDLDPHFEPEPLGDILQRLGVESLAVRLKPRPAYEVAAAHAADLQSDLIVSTRVVAYYATNGEPADRLLDRFQGLIDNGKAEGMFTGNSDAELVRVEVHERIVKSPHEN